MVRLFVRHDVTDYGKWRAGYDDFDSTRRSMGVKGDAVYRNVENGNDITVYHDFDSIEMAKSFAGSSQLREVMGQAGVVGQPQIWFVEQS
jgi:hypothetical protein